MPDEEILITCPDSELSADEIRKLGQEIESFDSETEDSSEADEETLKAVFNC